MFAGHAAAAPRLVILGLRVLVNCPQNLRQTLSTQKYAQFVDVLLARTETLPGRVLRRGCDFALREVSSKAEVNCSTPPEMADLPEIQDFVLVVAPDIWALLIAESNNLPGYVTVQLTFEPTMIQTWGQFYPSLNGLTTASPPEPLTALSQQNQILWDLLVLSTAELSPQNSTCQPQVNLAVNQRIHRERLIHQITTQIRQSLDLSDILNTAVSQIRDFLQADRVLITEWTGQSQGTLIYEAQGSGAWQSMLGTADVNRILDELGDWSRLRAGEIVAYSDSSEFSHGAWQDLLHQYQVKSLLLVPIMVQGTLWGLLIAQHCQDIRIWLPQEQEFLCHICDHVSIALYQSQLYRQLQQQKATLEDRVAERTQALRQSVLSAESAQRVKSDFLATISHELRSPLTCVIGMSSTLLRWPLGPLTEKQRHYLETIHDSGTHLLELINRILELSQVEVGQTALRIRAFSLSQLARQVLQRVRAMALTAQLNLNLDLDIAPESDTFTADPHRLQQVLIHLLTNAIKFTPAQGHVTLRVVAQGDQVEFAVMDTGIGIPAHLQPLLFQLFQQLDTPYRRCHEGMGLGLAFTKQIVDLHQGSITVQSQEQQGATFTVIIPRQAWAPTLSPTPPPPEGRIILIEDQEETATLICELLTAAGYQVVWMTDPVIEQLSHFQPLMVIVSQRLHHFDLHRLIQHLQQNPNTQHTKTLVLRDTGLGGNSPAMAPNELKGDAYLSYPIDPEKLLAQIAALLQPETSPRLVAEPFEYVIAP